MESEKKTSKTESIIMYVLLSLTMIFGAAYLLTHDNCSRFSDVWQANVNTRYEVRIQVEDTAYALIDAYNANVSLHNQYCDIDNTKANEAKVRANAIAIIYNEFISKSIIVWDDNMPTDIEAELIFIK